jgi:hypothetical protein
MYGASFQINTVSLADFLEVHFDLFTLNDDGSVETSAPFSHDASSWPPAIQVVTVSEPATLGLFGLALLGLAMARHRWQAAKTNHPSSRSPRRRDNQPMRRAGTEGHEGLTAGVRRNVEKIEFA